MKKKILIGLGVLIVLLVVVFAYMNYRNRTLSPPGSTEISHQGVDISVEYSRPSVRDRVIFGPDETALQPNGVYWRLGANESTKIVFGKDVLLNGESVKAGTYKIYCYPGEEAFDFRLNTELGAWGYSESDHATDVMQTDIPVLSNGHVEQFTMELRPAGDGILLEITWDKVKLQLPIEPVR